MEDAVHIAVVASTTAISATRLYGIIGSPLGHSLSPCLHNWAFAAAGIPAVYLPWPLQAGKVGDFLTAMRTLPIAGASVTIPHKETVLALLDGQTEAARAVGAVNTLYWENGQLLGDNTDVAGFLAPLEGHSYASALVLGAGGAARAVLAGLKDLGVAEVFLANRSADRAAALAAEFGAIIVDWDERGDCAPDLLVNTTPLGMAGAQAAASPWPEERFRPGQTAYDLVYNPLETRFLAAAAAAGCRVVDGLAMFLGQALGQFRRWTGCDFALDRAREKLLETLGR